MNTLIQPLMKWALFMLLPFAFLFSPDTSGAVVTNTILSQDFSGNSINGFPDQNWYTDGYGMWYGSNSGVDQGSGDGGQNGSAMINMFDYCGSENLYSPQFDASPYSGAGATVTLSFNYWWESTFWDQNIGNNTVSFYANDGNGNQILLGQLNENSDFTFNTGDFSENYYDPLSDPSFWGTMSYTVPASFATSALQIIITGDATGVCGGGGNFGVDNIVVTGTMPENISFAPTLLSFGSVASTTQSVPQCVTLTNPGPNDLPISSAQITGVHASEFMISGTVPSVIPAGGSADICVLFAPQGNGLRVADLIITDGSDNNPTIDISLSGTGIAPIVSIIPIGISNTPTKLFRLTSTRLGDTLRQSLLVKNSGAGILVIDGNNTYIGGDYPGEYTITRVPSLPLAPGESDTLSVIFHPTMEGIHSAKLYIASNADNG
ncbi:MAG: choice-of-anchor D domain-containing protein, partial [Ignavibacteriota bacterium]